VHAQARQIAQFTNLASGNETGSQQSMLQQLGNPFTIFLIRLASRQCLHVLRVHQQDREFIFQHIPDWLPIHTGRFHGHVRDVVREQP